VLTKVPGTSPLPPPCPPSGVIEGPHAPKEPHRAPMEAYRSEMGAGGPGGAAD